MVTRTRQGWALLASVGTHLFLLGVVTAVATSAPQGFATPTTEKAPAVSAARCSEGQASVVDVEQPSGDADFAMTVTDCGEQPQDHRISHR